MAGVIFGGIGACLFLVVALFADPRPSSTSGLAILALPVIGGVGSAAGLVLGTVVWLLGLLFGRTLKAPLLPTAIGTAIVAIAGALGLIVWGEFASRPRVLLSGTEFAKKDNVPAQITSEKTAALTAGLSLKSPTAPMVSWNTHDVAVLETDGRIEILRPETGVFASTKIDSFDYVTDVYALPVGVGGGNDYLAVFVDLRATSNRAMLLIFDSAGALV